MKLRLLYHGHCFDGVASAATFTRFYKERIHPEAEVSYGGLLHRPGNLFDFELLEWALTSTGFQDVRRISEADLLARFPEFPERGDDLQSLYVRASLRS